MASTGAPSAALRPAPESRSNRPRLLDLFCGAGGAAMGYYRAGFEVIGIDSKPQPDYPFEFLQHDALDFLDRWDAWLYSVRGFDAVHASPPCQAFTSLRALNLAKNGRVPAHPDYIRQVRRQLQRFGKPYVIENVVGAPLLSPLTLCGSMFGLGVRRHRLFESNVLLFGVPDCEHTGHEFVGVYGDHAQVGGLNTGDGYIRRSKASTIDEARAAMGIDWMKGWRSLCQAVPPAYTEWIGRQLVGYLTERREVAATG